MCNNHFAAETLLIPPPLPSRWVGPVASIWILSDGGHMTVLRALAIRDPGDPSFPFASGATTIE
jgi:hypothetical protein